MTTSQDTPSAENLALECDTAARDLKAAASALRHGRNASASQKLQRAEQIIRYVRRFA